MTTIYSYDDLYDAAVGHRYVFDMARAITLFEEVKRSLK